MIAQSFWWRTRPLLPRRPVACGLALLWGAGIAGTFCWSQRALLAPAGGFGGVLATAALVTYVAAFAGFRVSSRLSGTPLERAGGLARTAIELALGVSLLVAIMFLLGVLRLYRVEAVAAALLVVLAGSHRAFWRSLRGRFRGAGRARGDPVAWLCLVLVGAMTLLESVAPATSQDALVYHLALPAHYLREGGITYVPGNFFGQFPQNVEMLFTLGLLLGGDALACWFHWLLGACAALAVAGLAQTVRRGARAEIAAAAFVTIPTAALIAGWAYVDLGVTFFALTSTLAFLLWLKDRASRSLLVVAAVLAGVTAGCKYTGGVQGLLLAAAVALVALREGGGARRAFALAAAIAAITGLVASPWWIKNIILTGNPLHPFAFGLFGGRDWDAERAALLAQALSQWGGERGLPAALTLPWRVTMSGEFFSIERFDGVIGALFLMAAPLLVRVLARAPRARIIAVFLLGEALFWAFMTWQIRFLLPALALAAALLAGHPVWRSGGWPGTCWRGLARGVLILNTLVITFHFAAHNPAAVALGLEPRDAYLAREVPGGDYEVFRYIDRELPAESRILFGSLGNPGFLCKRPYHADAFFENHTVVRWLAETSSPAELLGRFRAEGFTHFLFRWENVFDPTNRRSEIPVPAQRALAEFLNVHGRMRIQRAGTFLYEIVDEPRELPVGEAESVR